MKKLSLLSLLLLIVMTIAAQKNQSSGVVISSEFHTTRPLREIFAEHPANENNVFKEEEESEDRKNRIPQKFRFSVKDGRAYGNDENTLQRKMGDVPALPVRANWSGQNASGFRPFDPTGAIGPNHYVQMINATTFKVYDKLSGAVILTGALGNLWSPVTTNSGDPIVMYDKAADRWFLAQFGTSTDKKIYIAVSQTGDPTGAYYTYTYVSPSFPDYLKFSVWADAYYMTSNQPSQKVFAFNRSEILAGTPGARSVFVSYTPPKSGFFCPLAGDAADGVLPTAGTPCPIFSYSDNGWGTSFSDAVNIYQMAVDWTPLTPTATITLAGNLPTAAFDASYATTWNDCPQPGTTQKLDGIGGVCMYRAQWKTWNGYNTILLNWAVKINASQRGIKWCELRQNQTNGIWSIYQEGIYAPDAATRWMGSMAMDNNGSIGLSYIKSDAVSIYPGLYYTGRRSCDPLGTLPVAEALVVAGTGSQTGMNRVGDYAHTTLDMDGITFWSTSEFMGGLTGSSAAKTRIFSYQIAPCSYEASVTIALTTGSNPGCIGNNNVFMATAVNGGTNPSYQWMVNGINVGTNSQSYSSSILNTNDVITCVMTSNFPGATGSPATSNAINMILNPLTIPSISIAINSGTNPTCASASVTFTAASINGGTSPSFQWQINGINVGTNSPTYTSNSLSNGQVIQCLLLSSEPCANPSSALSNSIAMTVNPMVSPIVNIALTAGNNPSCSGDLLAFTATSFNAGTPSFQWKVDGINVGVDSMSYSGSTFSNGQIVSCEMIASNVCTLQSNAVSNSIAISVNSILTPSISISMTNGSNPFCAGSSITFSATTINGGSPDYQWMIDGTNTGTNSSTYTSTALSNGQFITCKMTSSLNCSLPSISFSNTLTTLVNPILIPEVSITITSGTNPLCAGSAVTFEATPLNGGIPFYQWKIDGVNVGSNSSSFSSSSLSNGQIVSCEMSSTENCASPSLVLSNELTMIVNPVLYPSVSIGITNGSNPMCVGSSTTFHATPLNGGIPSYQWLLDGIPIGANDPDLILNSLTNGQTIRCEMTSTAGCTNQSTVASNILTMTVNQMIIPSVSIAVTSGSNSICAGSSVTFTANSINGGGTPSYQWQVDGVNVGINSSTLTTNTLNNNQVVNCILTSSELCAYPSITQSNSITMVVVPLVTPAVSISISSGTNPMCSGNSVSFTALPINGGNTAFQWTVNGANTGVNSSNFTLNTPSNGNVVACILTSSLSCITNTTASSNTITTLVTTNVTPTVSIALTSGSNPSCSGTSLTFSATPFNGGSTPQYQWKKNGLNVGTNSSLYTTSTSANGDIVSVQMTSSSNCASPLTATSNAIAMAINLSVTPSVTISQTTGTNPTCSGSAVTFTATAVNGGTPLFQWKVNGVNAGNNSSTFTSSTLATNSIVTCIITSNASCSIPLTATSNSITMVVNSIVTPSVSIAITTGANPTCSSLPITFTASPINGGVSPSFQWKVSGVNAGTNSPTFTATTLTNNNIVTCVMTTSALCVTANTATSNSVTMNIVTSVTPTISIAITSGSNPTCAGTSVTYKATISNGGTPIYQWKINGLNVGTNSSTYSNSTLSNGQVVTCSMTSSVNCAIPSIVTSNGITMTINPIVTPSVGIAITNGSNPKCSNSSITFTATPINGGSAPSYQWKSNNTTVGTNSPVFTSSSLTNGKIIKCILTSSATCATTSAATSNSITLVVSSSLTPSVVIAVTGGGNPFCANVLVTLTATPTNGGTPSYQWKKNGIAVGTNSSTYATNTLNGGEIITCVMTSSLSCATPVTATSNAITMIKNTCFTTPSSIIYADGDNLSRKSSGVTIGVKVLLSGPYDAYEGLMYDSLRTKHLIPLTEPYSSEPFNFPQISYQGGETVSESVLSVSGRNAIIDWVYLELRSASSPSNVVATKRALLQRNGDVVSYIDGISPVQFENQDAGNYFVSVRHRNHLGVMTMYAIPLSINTTTIDFSTTAPIWNNQKIKNPPCKIEGNRRLLFVGDADANQSIEVGNTFGDFQNILCSIGLRTFNNECQSYSTGDVNMDSKIRYTNTNNDKNVILHSIGIQSTKEKYLQHIPK